MLKSSDVLLKARLCFYGVTIAHLLLSAIWILPIDVAQDEDPKISVYGRLRWKLLTCWCNLMLLAYFPISFYCDWKEKRGEWQEAHVARLRKFRDYFMTCLLLPSTLYCDISFWILWTRDPALIAPLAVFKYLPYWAQHSLHTVSGVTVVMDVILLPRKRPANLLPGIVFMYSCSAIYAIIVAHSQWNGEPVYTILHLFNWFELTLFTVYSLIQMLFFHSLQWLVIDYIWGKESYGNTKKHIHNTTQKHKLL